MGPGNRMHPGSGMSTRGFQGRGAAGRTFVDTEQVSQLFLGHTTLFRSELWTPVRNSVAAGRPVKPGNVCWVPCSPPASFTVWW